MIYFGFFLPLVANALILFLFLNKNIIRMKYLLIIYIFISFGLLSCTQNPYERNIDDISVQFTILPHHSDIRTLSQNFTEQNRTSLSEKYGPFFESYNSRIVQLGLSTDTSFPQKLQKLLEETWIQDIYKKTNEVFADTTYLYKELEPALQYFSYYFPNKTIPRFATFVGAVQYSVVIDSNLIAIGIDKYLGQDFQMYKDMEISSFVRRNMYKEKIASDVMRAMAENEFPNPCSEQYLLAHMIQHGRYMYFVRCMLPHTPDSVMWGYTTRQLEFCSKSESEFWKYFVSTDNTLFSSDYMTIKRFIDDGPFTPVFTKESPGKIGQWIGFKIVESYMKQNPQTTLEELFSIESAQEIMRKSKYNP